MNCPYMQINQVADGLIKCTGISNQVAAPFMGAAGAGMKPAATSRGQTQPNLRPSFFSLTAFRSAWLP
jgi:hypothetical protein